MAVLNTSISLRADDVREVIESNLSDDDIHRFMNQAYYVTRPLAGKLSDCGGAPALEEIQVQLAAHLISMSREFQAKSESIAGEASVTLRGQTGKGLEASTYGQNVLMMDCSGILRKLATKKKASFAVWSHDQIDYDADA